MAKGLNDTPKIVHRSTGTLSDIYVASLNIDKQYAILNWASDAGKSARPARSLLFITFMDMMEIADHPLAPKVIIFVSICYN